MSAWETPVSMAVVETTKIVADAFNEELAAAKATTAGLEQRVDELEAALVPFAKMADVYDDDHMRACGLNPRDYMTTDETSVKTGGRHGSSTFRQLFVRDLRRARAALTKGTTTTGGEGNAA